MVSLSLPIFPLMTPASIEQRRAVSRFFNVNEWDCIIRDSGDSKRPDPMQFARWQP